MKASPSRVIGFHSPLGKSWEDIHQPSTYRLPMSKPKQLPPPRKLTCHEVTEIPSRARPIVEMTIQRRFLWFTWTEEFAIYGGEWLVMLAGKVVRR